MSIGPILTLGLGAFTGGGVQYLPTLGYGTGGTPPPPPPVIVTTPGGVRKDRGKKVDLSDRKRASEFLKAQLKVRAFESAENALAEAKQREELKRLKGIERREAAMRKKAAADESARLAIEAAEEKRKQQIIAYNEAILKLIFMANL